MVRHYIIILWIADRVMMHAFSNLAISTTTYAPMRMYAITPWQVKIRVFLVSATQQDNVPLLARKMIDIDFSYC